ncbi:MFS general substrate transporter [Piromyces finnis]|uniref:MFS general substrate transporter n=1 Tax=Piromyces finnis TaxID=1754191 RepID=A0A1Y1VBT7_9FUNG|nr:MFS general substrate transporter [Piromyces finnis]|eukprot:ORX51411.1 MFS general substrate transporter [Piromyces finnis]
MDEDYTLEDMGDKQTLLQGKSFEEKKVEELKPNLRKDIWDFILLVILYFLQGIPLGLALGSLPFLLKSKMTYSDMAIFSITNYPYSMKLLWSPIVDSFFNKKFGRRKSWIVPIQLCSSFFMFFFGGIINDKMDEKKIPIGFITAYFTIMVILSATQDIALDGWALELLSKENLSYASTAQTVGLNTGQFLSSTVFLAFNSAEFSNKYLRSKPSEYGVLQLGPYLKFWAVCYFLVTLYLIVIKKEKICYDVIESIKEVYKIMWKVIKLPRMRSFIVLLFIAKIGFVTNDAVTSLKLLEKGFKREDLSVTVLIDFPLQIIFGYYAAKWSSGKRPLRPWMWAFYGRIAAAILAMFVVKFFRIPENGEISSGYFILIILSTVLSSFMSTVQFVSIGCFFARIADPTVGGTYMTLLNTLSNLGGTWPRPLILEGVDVLTDYGECQGLSSDIQGITCKTSDGRHDCISNGGQCEIISDGYYNISIVCIILALLSLFLFIKKEVRNLETTPKHYWEIPKDKDEKEKD